MGIADNGMGLIPAGKSIRKHAQRNDGRAIRGLAQRSRFFIDFPAYKLGGDTHFIYAI